MRSKNINHDGTGNGAESDFVNRVLERLNKEFQFFSSGTVTVEQTTRGTRFRVKPALGGAPAGGYMGTYDNTKSYASGQTVRVVTPTTIAGVSVPAGLFAVPPGVSVPANGTGFQIPQYPEPSTFTTPPNDKVYWHALGIYCT